MTGPGRLRCARFRRWILRSLSDDLPERKRGRLAEHLAACPGCLREAREAAALLCSLGAPGVPDPGPAYWKAFPGRVRRRIEEARARSAAPPPLAALQERACRAAVAAALAAAALLAALGAPPARRDEAAVLARAVLEPGLAPRILPSALEVEDPFLDLDDSLARLDREQAMRLRSRLRQEIGDDRLLRKEKEDAS